VSLDSEQVVETAEVNTMVVVVEQTGFIWNLDKGQVDLVSGTHAGYRTRI